MLIFISQYSIKYYNIQGIIGNFLFWFFINYDNVIIVIINV
jgi:hypothetical protein